VSNIDLTLKEWIPEHRYWLWPDGTMVYYDSPEELEWFLNNGWSDDYETVIVTAYDEEGTPLEWVSEAKVKNAANT
jgi:hypothetical protein